MFSRKNAYLARCYFLLICITVSLKAAGFGVLTDELPKDERTAILELEEGFFDSATWNMLKPFYTQPVSVPLGELRYLRDIFPDLPADLPVQPEVLTCYEPWTSGNIAIFFKDYPYLVPLRPLLSFETKKMPAIAHIGFFSNVSGLSNTFRQSTRFTITPVKYVRADGTVYFEENFARWQRRRILLKFPYLGKVQIGNLSFAMNSGLFYGYFPTTPIAHDTVKYNWLYGESRTWNGISSETPVGKKNIISTLIHTRKTESIAGLKAEFNPNPFLSLYGAFSGAFSQLDSITYDTSYAVHGGVAASIGLFTIKLESGANLLNARSIPVYVTLSHGKTKGKHTVSFIRIPGDFSAPRSSLLRSFYCRLDASDSTANDITGVNISFSSPIAGFFKQVLNASYIIMENNANLKTSWKISCSKPFGYSLYYSLNAYNLSDNLKHRFKISANYITGSVFGISSSVLYDITSEAYWRIMTNLQTDFKLFSVMSVSPFVTYISNSKAQDNLAVGIKQRMNFFEKTYGEVKFTFPILSHYNESYSFYAKTYFLF